MEHYVYTTVRPKDAATGGAVAARRLLRASVLDRQLTFTGEAASGYPRVHTQEVTPSFLDTLRAAVVDREVSVHTLDAGAQFLDIEKPKHLLDWLDDQLTPRENVYYGGIAVPGNDRAELRRLGIPVAELDYKTSEFIVRVSPDQMAALDPHWGRMVWSLCMVGPELQQVTWSSEAIEKLDDSQLQALGAYTRHQIIVNGGRLTAGESAELDFAHDTMEAIDSVRAQRAARTVAETPQG
jgi:hypothetical protein